MNPQDVQLQVIKQLKKTRTRSKIIKMVQIDPNNEQIKNELTILNKELYQVKGLIKLPSIVKNLNQRNLQAAIKEINPLYY